MDPKRAIVVSEAVVGNHFPVKLLRKLKFIFGVFLSKIVLYKKLVFFKHIYKHIIRRAIASLLIYY